MLVANQGFGSGEATVGVLLGNGDGTFQGGVAYAVTTPSTLAVADLNGDGKPDLVVGSCCNQTASVLLGNGDGTFRSPVVYPSVGYMITDIAVADVTGDGKPDLLVAGGSGIGMYRGRNGDGKNDVVVANGNPTNWSRRNLYSHSDQRIWKNDDWGVATLTKSDLAVGTHSITATYEGDAEAGTSASPAIVEVVN